MSEQKMTAEQKAYLQSLTCQRLSDEEGNRELAKIFRNDENSMLPDALRKGWNEDKQDEKAFYIVKDKNNQPLLFFTLVCGVVYIPIFYQKVYEEFKRAEALFYAAREKKCPKWAQEEIESRKIDGVLPMPVRAHIYSEYQKRAEEWQRLEKDLGKGGVKILRTKRTYPGVELVHFCVHEPAKETWVRAGMGSQSMGRTLFWWFIVPKIQEIRRLVGCEYFYLFAADGSEDRTLVKYYQTLGFERRDDVGVAKPTYDFGCTFMCQKLTSLKNKRADFLGTYNREKE